MNVDEIAEYLAYEPVQKGSSLVWKKTPRMGLTQGKRAGYMQKDTKYWRVGFNHKSYPAHVLVWVLHNKKFPDCQIDHIDNDKSNNKIENLRLAINNEKDNGQNRKKACKNNSTGFLGVSKCSDSERYRARITVDGRSLFLGNFNTLQEAKSAYINAKCKLHPFYVPGETQ